MDGGGEEGVVLARPFLEDSAMCVRVSNSRIFRQRPKISRDLTVQKHTQSERTIVLVPVLHVLGWWVWMDGGEVRL